MSYQTATSCTCASTFEVTRKTLCVQDFRSDCVSNVSRQAISRTRRTVSGSALWCAVWSAFSSRQPPARITSCTRSTFLRVAHARLKPCHSHRSEVAAFSFKRRETHTLKCS